MQSSDAFQAANNFKELLSKQVRVHYEVICR